MKPRLTYTQAFDVYSLSTVLLEIGSWQPLSTFEMFDSESGFRDNLVDIARNELPGQVGTIYAKAVRECSRVERDDSDAMTQQRLCWRVAAPLDQCVA